MGFKTNFIWYATARQYIVLPRGLYVKLNISIDFRWIAPMIFCNQCAAVCKPLLMNLLRFQEMCAQTHQQRPNARSNCQKSGNVPHFSPFIRNEHPYVNNSPALFLTTPFCGNSVSLQINP